MQSDWDILTEEQQVALAARALAVAEAEMVSCALTLAGEIEGEAIADRGGAEALRLLAALIRVAASTRITLQEPPAGQA